MSKALELIEKLKATVIKNLDRSLAFSSPKSDDYIVMLQARGYSVDSEAKTDYSTITNLISISKPVETFGSEQLEIDVFSVSDQMYASISNRGDYVIFKVHK